MESQSSSDAIHKHALQNYKLKCRIGVSDHSTCRRDATRASRSPTPDASAGNNTDYLQKSPFEILTNMLQKRFNNGNVYSMNDVTLTYASLLSKSDADNSIRSDLLKHKLIAHFGNTICFRHSSYLVLFLQEKLLKP